MSTVVAVLIVFAVLIAIGFLVSNEPDPVDMFFCLLLFGFSVWYGFA